MTDRYADVEFEGDARPWRISVGCGDTDESVRRHCARTRPALRVARVTFGADAGVHSSRAAAVRAAAGGGGDAPA